MKERGSANRLRQSPRGCDCSHPNEMFVQRSLAAVRHAIRTEFQQEREPRVAT
jgi:hypothetical protein